MALDQGDHFRHALPGEISFQVAQNIARAESLVFQTSSLFDRDERFSLARIAHAERRGDGRAADERAYLDDLSHAYFCKMIDEDQHIQMQHGIVVPDFEQLRMNGLLPVLHESMHQVQAIVELAVTAHGCRSLRCRPDDCVVARGTMSSHHDEIALCAVESRNTW